MSTRPSFTRTETSRAPPPPKQQPITSTSPTRSPEAKLFYYRAPSRGIPSPTNTLSIDRRDDDGNAGGVYAVRPSLQRLKNGHESAYGLSHELEKPSALSPESEKQRYRVKAGEGDSDGFFFYDPSWTSEDVYDVKSNSDCRRTQHHATTAAAVSPSSLLTREDVENSDMLNQRSAFDVSPPPPPSLSNSDPSSAREKQATAASHGTRENERQLRRSLRRYQRYVETELQPRMEELRGALQEKETECARLHADNVILANRLQRLQSALNNVDSTTTPTTESVKFSPPVSAVRSDDPALAVAAPLTVVTPTPLASDAQRGSEELQERLREASAEVTLLKRQLAALQGRHDRCVQSLGEGSVTSPPRTTPSASRTLGQTEVSESRETARVELLKLCRALAEDGLGFTAVLRDVQDRLSSDRSPSDASSSKDGVRSSPPHATNPFKAAVEEWRRFMRVTKAAVVGVSGSHALEGNPPHVTTDVPTACTTVLKALLTTLQTEHGAVAASMEAVQQLEKHHAASLTHHMRVVEQVRREAERRIEELEADHEAEVQTLESAIADLEQQVSMTTASRRPWTAGLFIHGCADETTGVCSPSSLNRRSSQEVGGAGGAVGGGGARTTGGSANTNGDAIENARRAAAGLAAAPAADTRAQPSVERCDADTQTSLSLEWIQACLQKAREEPMRAVRREKEAELVELMSTEVETLRRQLTDSRAVVTRLREEQRRFLGDVTLPVSYFDNFSSFPTYV
ncbi:hypothetical protein N2W54_007140 [Lotmaria passim]